MATVSFSEISTWKTCRQRWHWRYALNLDPNRYSDHITLGTLCHAGIEAWLRGTDMEGAIWTANSVEMFDEEIHALNEQRTLAQKVVERYVAYSPWGCNTGTAVAVEQAFSLRIPKTRHFVEGRFDSILRDSEGGLWLVEWKFPRAFRAEEDVQLSTQLAIYQWAALRCGYDVKGILYNQILPKLPQIPEQNKNGSTSRKEIYTDWETYAATVESRGDILANYEDEMRPKLADKEFWRSYRLYRTPEQVEQYVHELRAVACDIGAKNKRVYTCENHVHCGPCAYRELCLEKARGRDPQGMIDAAYKQRKQHDNTNDTTIDTNTMAAADL